MQRCQVCIGLVIEKSFVQKFGHQMGAAEIRRPESEPITGRLEDPCLEFALPILSQKPVFKIVKNPVPVECIVAARERSTGQGVNKIELVEEALPLAFPDNLLMSKLS